MKKIRAIELAGSASELAKVFGITPGAISQWGDDIPELRVWQLRELRPVWFGGKPSIVAPEKSIHLEA